MTTPPPDLPSNPAIFYSATALPELPPPDAGTVSALDQLSSCPLPKYKFPLLGFLATVYEHVSSQARAVGSGANRAQPPR